ncbi:TetR/AcrR family transcriptional regulator [Patulibacter brassicae]|uniref:TetR/AcrR family transcriptional regulator n=1 Tax=Patulibacter brassicae TaxID=1705717 RepID=A0ABU4VKH5_9ACTN|nr:TetR/AcrR family transcriptional regulator [Patulibacter brassicae]MDX8152351.1 TetR/AcrR family transcriptional regulator [Patulibacter brassicae]
MARASTPRRTLDEQQVVAAALRIADADGLDAVTMRRVGSALGVSAMALYNHVDGKDALVDLMVDRTLRELPAIDPEAAWEPELLRFFTALHRLLTAHPSVAEATLRRPIEGPVATQLADRVLELLTRAGFPDDEAAGAFVTLFNYACGASIYHLSRRRSTGGRLDGIDAAQAPTAHRLRGHLARAADDAHLERALRRIVASLRDVTPSGG